MVANCPPLSPPTASTVCGIFGYYNFHVARTRKDILECLLTGLRRLEYRGYDSAGLSIDVQPLIEGVGEDGAAAGGVVEGVSIAVSAPPLVIKSSGKIVELEKLAYLELSQKQVGGWLLVGGLQGRNRVRWGHRPAGCAATPGGAAWGGGSGRGYSPTGQRSWLMRNGRSNWQAGARPYPFGTLGGCWPHWELPRCAECQKPPAAGTGARPWELPLATPAGPPTCSLATLLPPTEHHATAALSAADRPQHAV